MQQHPCSPQSCSEEKLDGKAHLMFFSAIAPHAGPTVLDKPALQYIHHGVEPPPKPKKTLT